MNITTLDPTILVFLDINAGILIDGEKTVFCPLLAHTNTHTHTHSHNYTHPIKNINESIMLN